MQLDAVQDRTHGVFANAEMQHPAVGATAKHLLCRSVGRKLGSPSGVVLLDSARSAEPPQSSGNLGAIALSTFPKLRGWRCPLDRRTSWAGHPPSQG